MDNQTIYALATSAGKSGVAVIRISGAQSRRVIEKMCQPSTLPAPRHASLRKIIHPKSLEVLDHAVVVFYQAPRSFTGEDIVELHCHGGRAVVRALLDALGAMGDLRMAVAGEFTRRAFDNDRLDLTEVEGLADLIGAESEAQRRQAIRQYEGALGKQYDDWRTRLMRAQAYSEAEIDFSDEDLPQDVIEGEKKGIQKIRQEIEKHLDDAGACEALREGFVIAILGAPNAGKSSLLNYLARRDVAIVSPTPGTTRDVIEVQMELHGYPVLLQDTAGLRMSEDATEQEGIRRSYERAEKADYKILLMDGASALDEDVLKLRDDKSLLVISKADLAKDKLQIDGAIYISSKTGDGIESLIQKIGAILDARFVNIGTGPTRQRHREALGECMEFLAQALESKTADKRAEDIRMATRALGRITGVVDSEALLDIIFRDFCVGK